MPQSACALKSPAKRLIPCGPSPSSLTSLRRALAKKTVRSPSSSWERLQRAWWPTNSPSNPTVGGWLGWWNIFSVSPMSDSKLSARLASIYYSPKGYWKGIAAIQNLSSVKMSLRRGWRIRRSGRSIYLVRGTFRNQSSILIRRMRSTKLTCSFCHMTACLEVERRTSMHSPSLTLPRATRRPSLWPQKRLKRLLKLCLASTDGARWSGQNCEFMGAVNQLLAKHDVEVEVVWTSTGTRWSLSDSLDLGWAALWAPVCSRDAASFWRAVVWVGSLLTRGRRGHELRSDSAHRQTAFWYHQGTICDTKALLHCSIPSFWPSRVKAPSMCWRSLSVQTRRAGRRSSPCDWSSMVFDGSPALPLGDQAWRACVVLLAG